MRCNTVCAWRLRAIYKKKHGKFGITQYNCPHSCLYTRLSQNHNQFDSYLIVVELSSIIKKKKKPIYQCSNIAGHGIEKVWLLC